jgi:hypothetical protein
MPLCSKRIRTAEEPILAVTKGISKMQLSHVAPVRRAVFDDRNLVSAAGLVPVPGLAHRAGLGELAGEHLTVAGGPGHAAGLKVEANGDEVGCESGQAAYGNDGAARAAQDELVAQAVPRDGCHAEHAPQQVPGVDHWAEQCDGERSHADGGLQRARAAPSRSGRHDASCGQQGGRSTSRGDVVEGGGPGPISIDRD